MNETSLETKALYIGFLINLIMGVAGWYMFLKTDIDALFLDGNFSLISAFGCLMAVLISKYSHVKTKRFPHGLSFLEPLYGVIKSIFSLVLIFLAGESAIIKLYNYLFLNVGAMLQMGGILYYAIAMMILCFFMSGVFFNFNKKINHQSTMLSVESKASFVDGMISLSVGIAILLITLLPKEGNTIFVYYIGDALITIFMIIFLIKTPFLALKESFIELVFGVIKEDSMKADIEQIINENHFDTNINITQIYIYKTGKDLLVLMKTNFDNEAKNIKSVLDFKQNILKNIRQKYPKIKLEIALD